MSEEGKKNQKMAREVILWIMFALYKGQWEDPLA